MADFREITLARIAAMSSATKSTKWNKQLPAHSISIDLQRHPVVSLWQHSFLIVELMLPKSEILDLLDQFSFVQLTRSEHWISYSLCTFRSYTFGQ